MKKVSLSIIIISLLSADNLYTVNKKDAKVPVVNLNNDLILKSTTRSELESIDIFRNNWLVKGYNRLKIYNINNQDLLTDKEIKNSYKAKYTADGSKIIVLNSKSISVYDTKTLNKIGEFAGNYFDFKIEDNLLLLIGKYNSKSRVIDLNTGNAFLKLMNAKKGVISPNHKKIALYKYKKIYIFNLKGVLLNTISLNINNIYDIQWMDDKNIAVFENYNCNGNLKKDVKVVNVITSQFKTKIPDVSLDNFKVLTPNKLLLLNNNIAWIYNLSTKKTEKKYNLSENKNIKNVVLKDGYLSVSYEDKNAYLYKIDLINQDSKLITKTTTKILEKKVYIKQKNIKPTLEFFSSTSSGYSPLKVNFKILANDEDGKIVSYYINFAGKEILKKGNPTKTFSYTFVNPGNYNIMVAVKDNNGSIVTKKLTIKVREESFEDYKKSMMGN